MSQSDRQSKHGPFVGRKAELEAWKKVLVDPSGQAVLVTGQQGMGKTMLLNRMAEIAEAHPDLQCGHVRYEVTSIDAPDSTMALMLDQAYEQAKITKPSQRQKQWRAILNIFKVGELISSLRRDPAKSTRDQFLTALKIIAGHLDDNARLLIFVDPEKYLPEGSADTWRLVVRDLPDKIKLIFAQRLEDQLVGNADFSRLNNVVRVSDITLSKLTVNDIDDLIAARHSELPVSAAEAKQALKGYDGHPYAVGAALGLLASGLPSADLPTDPDGLAAEQWKRAQELGGMNAWKLMTAYAILEVAVPDDVVLPVAELTPNDLRVFHNHPFLRGLLREESGGWRLYHVLVQDHRLDLLSEDEANEYHHRAIEAYRSRLNEQTKPDALAATRLPEHILAYEGEEAFIRCVLNDSTQPLNILGLLDELVILYQRTLDFVTIGSHRHASLCANLGAIYLSSSDSDQAEIMLHKSLEIQNNSGREEGTTEVRGGPQILDSRLRWTGPQI